jgi:hypothetical protein
MTYKRRLIWDFGEKRVVASWMPQNQAVKDGPIHAAFALSADGNLFAEGASGTVRIYRVGP